MNYRRRWATDWRLLVVTSVVSAVMSSGCTQDPSKSNRPKTVKVTGEVLYRGKPLAGAIVTFTHSEENRGAAGTTDAKGRFSLMTFEPGDGAVPGPQKVTVYKATLDFPHSELEGKSQEEVQEAFKTWTPEKLAGLPDAVGRWEIPKKYGDAVKSGLTATVVDSGENHFRFELHD